MPIQLFAPKFRVEECLAEIRECLEKGWTGIGFKTLEMEKAWKEYTGFPHAHFLNSNTSGLHLAFEIFKKKYGWLDGDEVITTPLTFVSVNHAILYANLKPIFADVDQYLCLDLQSIEARISNKTKAVIFVGIGGNAGQYEEIVKLCKKRGLKLILDAAHMAGTRLHGKHICHDADAVVYSFQAVKNLPTADSGMICFHDSVDDEKVRQSSWMGINKDTYTRAENRCGYDWRYDVQEIGFKYYGNSIMAGIGLVSLKYLDQDNAYRRQLASWYREKLSGYEQIGLIPLPAECESSTHLFQLRLKNRDAVMAALHGHEIYPGVHYRDNTEYPMYQYGEGSCPNAAQASREILSLPMHMSLTNADVELISDLVIRYAK